MVPVLTVETEEPLLPSHEGTLEEIGQIASGIWSIGKLQASRYYWLTKQKSGELIAHLKGRAERTGEEEPLRIVAAAAGAAFLLGVLLRIWRSRIR